MTPSKRNFETDMRTHGIVIENESQRQAMYNAYVLGWEQAVIHDPIEEEKRESSATRLLIFGTVVIVLDLLLHLFLGV